MASRHPTQIVVVNRQRPEPGPIARAAEVILRGGLVAFPTETVYGLGANALDPEAVERIFRAKGRPAANPVIVHVPDAEAAREVVAAWPPEAQRLADRFWPGPLTLVLPRAEDVPDAVTAGGSTVGVRAPGHPVALALLRRAGVPIAAPSANRSSRLSPTRAEHVLRSLGGRIDLILDAGPTPGGIESTVLDLASRPARLLRPGLVSQEEIEEELGSIAGPSGAEEGRALRSPGMLRRHYAPATPLEAMEAGALEHALALARAGLRVGLMVLSPPGRARRLREENLLVEVLPADPAGFAARLYDVLHALDASGLDRIVVELPPESTEWTAVRDRLLRATAEE